MERRRAMIVAATASLTLLAGAAAIGLNSGIVNGSGNDGVGEISPIDVTTPGSDTPTVEGATTFPGRSTDDDRDDENDDGSHDVSIDGTYEHEYEGAEDDD